MYKSRRARFKPFRICYSIYDDSAGDLFIRGGPLRGRRAPLRPGWPRSIARRISCVPVSLAAHRRTRRNKRAAEPPPDRRRHGSVQERRPAGPENPAPPGSGEIETAAPDRYAGAFRAADVDNQTFARIGDDRADAVITRPAIRVAKSLLVR